MRDPIRAVIFDMDGLMLDTERIAQLTWNSATRSCGQNFGDELFEAMIGCNAADNRTLLAEHLGDNDLVERIMALWADHYEGHIAAHGIPTKTGIFELLQWLAAEDIPRAVATSTAYELALHKLTITGLRPHFEHVVGGDQVANGKPAPDLFLAAAARLGTPPAACVVLEDSEPGLRGARAAGMTTILIPDLKAPSAQARALATQVCGSLHEACVWLAASGSKE